MLESTSKEVSRQAETQFFLGARLRTLRKAAGLSQVGLAARMGRTGKGASNLVSRLEADKVEHPTLRVLSEFVKACGASLADVADVLGIKVEGEPKSDSAQKHKHRLKPKPRTPEQKLARLEAELGKSVYSGLFEETLYGFLKDSGIAEEYEDRKALAEHGRAFFQLLLRHHRAAQGLRTRTAKASRLSPEQIESVETVVRRTFDVLRTSGDLERKVTVNREAALSGKARVRPVKKAETRLAEDLQHEIDAWTCKRTAVTSTIRRDCPDFLLKQGVLKQEVGRYLNFVSELCARAEETETDPVRRRAALEQFFGRARNKEQARKLAEFVFQRWDELKDRIPPRPKALLARQRKQTTDEQFPDAAR